jgi:hypothetical protein
METRSQKGINVGSASILLIFTVLSLVSFATLTLVNSKADYNLSQNLAERQSAYYSACHKGNAFIAAVNSGYEAPAEDGIVKTSIPITDNQSLDIALMSNIGNNSVNSANKYTISQWQIVNHADNDYDYTLPVYK